MYVVLTTYPQHGSGNVGDLLITHSALEMLRAEKGEVETIQLFRGDPLDEHLDTVNRSRAVLMPGFAIRDPLHPNTYALTSDLQDIEVPLIPIGTGWKAFPGDLLDRSKRRYTESTLTTLQFVASQVEQLTCREYLTQEVLNRHGITNTIMVGDCAWYDIPSLGRPMKRPKRVERIVFTPPPHGTVPRPGTRPHAPPIFTLWRC